MKQEVSNNFIHFVMGPIQDFFFLSKFYAFPFLSADFCTQKMKAARTIDGTCNDLNNTAAGSRFYRFGRNVPLEYTYTNSTRLLSPDPRILART